MVVLVPHIEVLKTLPVLRLATNTLIVSVDVVVGVKLLTTTLAGKHMATVLPNFVLVFAKTQKLCHRHYRGEPSPLY